MRDVEWVGVGLLLLLFFFFDILSVFSLLRPFQIGDLEVTLFANSASARRRDISEKVKKSYKDLQREEIHDRGMMN